MRFRKLAAGISALAFSFTIQPAQAIEASDFKPLVDITSESDNVYANNYDFFEMTNGNLVSVYLIGNKFFAKSSTDEGQSWSAGYELLDKTGLPSNIHFERLNATQFIMVYPTGYDTNAEWVSVVFSVDNGQFTKGSPTIIYENDNINRQVDVWTQATVIAAHGAIYVYLPIQDMMDFNNPNSVYEFMSTNNGATWTKTFEVFTAAENFRIININVSILTSNTRAISPTMYVNQTNTAATKLKYFDGTSWEILQENLSSNERVHNLRPINDGAGMIYVTGEHSKDVDTYVWQSMDSVPVITLTRNDGDAAVYDVVTDGQSRIAITYMDRANASFYGARSLETLISVDAGLTWTNVIHESIDDSVPAADYRLYANFVLLGDRSQILVGYYINTAEMDGFTLKLTSSNDNGKTWSATVTALDGMVNDAWNEISIWNTGSDPYIAFTKAYDLANNYYSVPSLLTFKESVVLPEKTSYKLKFNYGKFTLNSVEKSVLRTWANTIPDGSQMTVQAPNYTSVNSKINSARSIARANEMAKVLRNSGLVVTVQKGKLVKKLFPTAGREVIARITVK